MIILHTSDWHLGRTLHGRRRFEEFEAFLAWLADTIVERGVDALLVAGDIFDTTTPGNHSQELYYHFLHRVAASPCRHVVIIAGNHDSPSFIDAPGALLRSLHVHVVGSPSDNPADEVLVLRDARGAPELIICAVPHLRDRDVRVSEAGESIDDKSRRLLDGIRQHYAQVTAHASRLRDESGIDIPIVAMGHLFTTGGRTVDGDGVRDLYVGSLAVVPADIFPAGVDYAALGHLHVPQMVEGNPTRRYCGSPIPMGFGEATQQKSLCLVAFHGRKPEVSLIDIPVFHQLVRIRGDWDAIERRLIALADESSRAWLDIVHDGDDIIGDLRERLGMLVDGTAMEILTIRDVRIMDRALQQSRDDESLDDLDVHEVFTRCLTAHGIPEERHGDLRHAYQVTISSLHDDDARNT